MFARSSVLFAAIAALVAAQQPPACASTCITGSLSSSNCETASVQCLCTSQSFIDAVVSCVQSTCQSSDYGAALDYAQSLCSGAGVTLSINTATFTAGGAQASSASAEASTTSSSAAESSEASATSSSADETSSTEPESSAAESTEASSAAEASVTSVASTISTSTTSGGTTTTAASGTTSSAATSTGAASARFDPISIPFACIGAVVVSFIAGVASFGW
ncbi:hypothetical protein V1517DRAFT_305121 [Lipomyces orientalis]|uniref:Uncharacterized protein n=1 Tax=Lipomyces orientalis TaxID=1233043 RepID=A0ACC3TWY4_9ASCO